jgi:hypothetical protein
MITREGKVKNRVKAFLHSRRVQSLVDPIENAAGFYWMPVVGVFGAPFVDFMICYRGAFIAVETKATGREKEYTRRQEIILRMVLEGGGRITKGDAETVIPELTTMFNCIDAYVITHV